MKRIKVFITLIFIFISSIMLGITVFADVTVANQNFDMWDNLDNKQNWSFPYNSTQLSEGKDGGKALKLTLTDNLSSTWLSYKPEYAITSGTVKISYSVRPGENLATQLTAYNADETKSFTTLFMQKTGVFASGAGFTDYKKYDFSDKFELDRWYDVVAIVNLDTGYTDVKITDENGNVYSAKNDRHSLESIDHLKFVIWSEPNCSSYIDNFSISKVSAAVSYSDIAVGNITNENPVCSVTVDNYTSSKASAVLSWNVYDVNDKLLKTESKTISVSPNSSRVVSLDIDPNKYGVFYTKINTSIAGRQSGKNYVVNDEKKIDFSKVIKTENNNKYIGGCYGYRGGEPDSVIKIADMGGYSGFRFPIYWGDVEKEKGQYVIGDNLVQSIQKTKNSGMDTVVCLLGDNSLYFDETYDSGIGMPKTNEQIEAYAKFCANVAKQLKGIVDNFEIWNEPSVPGFNGNQVDGYTYAKIVKAAYIAIKNENPDAKVLALGGGSYDYLEWTLNKSISDVLYGERPNILEYCDAISIHPYDQSNGYIGFPDNWITVVKKFKELLENKGSNIPLWITEYGWSTYDDSNYDNPFHDPVTYEQQAINLTESAIILKSYGYVDKNFLYSFVDTGTNDEDAEDRWGIVTNHDETCDGGYHAKNAYAALSALNHFLSKGMTPMNKIEDESTLKNGIHIFSLDDGLALTALWSETEKTKIFKLNCKNADIYDMYGNVINSMSNDLGIFSVNVGSEPVYLVGQYSACNIASDIGVRVDECYYNGDKNIIAVKGYSNSSAIVDIEIENENQVVKTYYTDTRKDGTFEMFFSVESDGNYTVNVGKKVLGEIGIEDYYSKNISTNRNIKEGYNSYIRQVSSIGVDKLTGKVSVNAVVETNDDNEECIVLLKNNEENEPNAANTGYVGTFKVNNGTLNCEFKIPVDKIKGVYDLYIAPVNGEETKRLLYSVDMFKVISLDMRVEDKLIANMSFTNTTQTSQNALIVITQYDEEGKMIGVDYKSVALETTDTDTILFETTKLENAVSYKAFIWDSFLGMHPFFRNIEKTEVDKDA